MWQLRASHEGVFATHHTHRTRRRSVQHDVNLVRWRDVAEREHEQRTPHLEAIAVLQRSIVCGQSIDESGIAVIAVAHNDLLSVPREDAMSRRDRCVCQRDAVAAIATYARLWSMQRKCSTAQWTTDCNQAGRHRAYIYNARSLQTADGSHSLAHYPNGNSRYLTE